MPGCASRWPRSTKPGRRFCGTCWCEIPLLSGITNGARPLRNVLIFLAGFYLVDQLRVVAASQPFLARLLFLVEMSCGAIVCLLCLRKSVLNLAAGKLQGVLRVSFRAGLALLAGVVIANA